MACCNLTTNTTARNNNTTICDALRKIDIIQREATRENCDTCLLGTLYNTKPVALYIDGERLTVSLDAAGATTTNLFRIEEVRGCETVQLRALTVNGDTITCTNLTIVIRVSCICGIQCFPSILCQCTLAN